MRPIQSVSQPSFPKLHQIRTESSKCEFLGFLENVYMGHMHSQMTAEGEAMNECIHCSECHVLCLLQSVKTALWQVLLSDIPAVINWLAGWVAAASVFPFISVTMCQHRTLLVMMTMIKTVDMWRWALYSNNVQNSRQLILYRLIWCIVDDMFVDGHVTASLAAVGPASTVYLPSCHCMLRPPVFLFTCFSLLLACYLQAYYFSDCSMRNCASSRQAATDSVLMCLAVGISSRIVKLKLWRHWLMVKLGNLYFDLYVFWFGHTYQQTPRKKDSRTRETLWPPSPRIPRIIFHSWQRFALSQCILAGHFVCLWIWCDVYYMNSMGTGVGVRRSVSQQSVGTSRTRSMGECLWLWLALLI